MTTLRPATRPIPEPTPATPAPQRIELSIDTIALRGMPDPGPAGRRLIAQTAQTELTRLIQQDTASPHATYQADSVRGGSVFSEQDPRRLGEGIAKAIHRGLQRG